jgi:hypothetical protein
MSLISLPSTRVREIPSDDQVSVADIIDLLCIKAPNCVSLIIAAPDTPLSAVTEGIRDVAFPLIARLSLLVCDQRNVRFGCLRPVRVVNQPTPGAISAAHSIRPFSGQMALGSVGMDWLGPNLRNCRHWPCSSWIPMLRRPFTDCTCCWRMQ